MIHELQQARKKAGLVGSRCKGGKGPAGLKYRRSSVFIRVQQGQVAFRECKRLLTEKEEKEPLSRLCKGREKEGEREMGELVGRGGCSLKGRAAQPGAAARRAALTALQSVGVRDLQ